MKLSGKREGFGKKKTAVITFSLLSVILYLVVQRRVGKEIYGNGLEVTLET